MIGCIAALACMGMVSFSSDAGTPASMVQGLSTVVSLPIVFAECLTESNRDFKKAGVVPTPELRVQAADQSDLVIKLHQELQDTDPRSSLAGFNMGLIDLNSFLESFKQKPANSDGGQPNPNISNAGTPDVGIQEQDGYITTAGVITVPAGQLALLHFSEKVSIDDLYKMTPLVIYCQHQRAETFWKTVAIALGAHIHQVDNSVTIYPNLDDLKLMTTKAYGAVGPNYKTVGPIRCQIAQMEINSMNDDQYQTWKLAGTKRIPVTDPQMASKIEKLVIAEFTPGPQNDNPNLLAGKTILWKDLKIELTWPGQVSFEVTYLTQTNNIPVEWEIP